jgi:predicted ATP-grasp superfamily ATP-dependent carboligase
MLGAMTRTEAPIRIVLSEWCLSGGLAGGDAPIVREGRMMLEALAADAAKESAIDVAVLVEEGRPIVLPSRARSVPVRVGDHDAALVAAARTADWTVVVAPESDGILARLVRAVRAAGGRVLAPNDRVIETASDKQATSAALAAHGIPVPAGRALAAGESIPAGFRMPAVRKSRSGCGGEGLEILSSRDGPPAPHATRLESLVGGTPVGVSCICGPRSIHALPPMRQVFTAGSAPRYLGSDLVDDDRLAARATALGIAAAAAVGADAGWLGVDMILGDRADGRDDRVLEVNPRVTTSFVGLARLFPRGLVAAMIDAAAGRDRARPSIATPRPGCSFRLPDA